MKNTITITVSGSPNVGKSAVSIEIAKFLLAHGFTTKLELLDGQEILIVDDETQIEKFETILEKDPKIVIKECGTSYFR